MRLCPPLEGVGTSNLLEVTLIHTEITPRWALQVSDRLLSVTSAQGVETFDERSNKTIVFHGSDGAALLSYTGLAFLEQAPTDSWIASKLNGSQHPFDPRDVDFAIRFGIRRSSWPKLGLALRTLADDLTELSSRTSRLRVMPVTIAVAGWLWYRSKPPRPFIAVIRELTRGHYVVDWAPRRYGKYFLHLVAPTGYLSAFERSEIDRRLAGIALPEDAATVLASSIRRVGARTATVGADCMAASIDHPWAAERKIRTEFLLNDGEVPSQSRTTPRFMAYSPWVIGPHECFPPALMVGGASMTVRVGIYDFERRGPGPEHSPPPGVAFVIDAQTRKSGSESGGT